MEPVLKLVQDIKMDHCHGEKLFKDNWSAHGDLDKVHTDVPSLLVYKLEKVKVKALDTRMTL